MTNFLTIRCKSTPLFRTYKVDSILVTSCNKKRSTTNKKSSEYLSFLLSSPFIKHLVSLKCNDFLGNIIDIAHNPNCNSHPNRSSRVRKTKKFILNGHFLSTKGALNILMGFRYSKMKSFISLLPIVIDRMQTILYNFA